MSGLAKQKKAGLLSIGFVLTQFSFSPVFAEQRPFNLGSIATSEQVAGWDIDVRPDGLGAPIGAGNAIDGEAVYTDRCASCHGDFGEAVDNWPALVGGEGTLASHDPVKTTGSYWPYASTMYDYIYRAMPFGEAQSLTHNETYQIVAYLLNMNDIIDEEYELNHNNIGLIEMPNHAGFLIPDPRPDAQPISGEPCMNDCDVPTQIIGKARDIDVTPENES
jgi:mono/diheme cytochrome c family protein